MIATIFATSALATSGATLAAPALAAPATMVGGRGSLPPAYLAVSGAETCLGSKSVGTSSIVCMPKTMPAGCTQETWGKLSAENMGLVPCDDDARKIPGSNPPTYTPKNLDEKTTESKMADYGLLIKKSIDDQKARIELRDQIVEAILQKHDMYGTDTFLQKHGIESEQGLQKFMEEQKISTEDAKKTLEGFVGSGKYMIDSFLQKRDIQSEQDLLKFMEEHQISMEDMKETLEGLCKVCQVRHRFLPPAATFQHGGPARRQDHRGFPADHLLSQR